MFDDNNDNHRTEDGGFDRLLGYLVQRLPQIRGEVGEKPDFCRNLLDDLPIAVRLQDQNLVTRYCNRAFCRLVGRDRDRLIGQGASVYVSPNAQLKLAQRTMRAELTRRCRATVVVELTHAAGHTVDVVMVARPIRIDDEVLVLGVYLPRDELTTALESPKILSSADTESGSTAN
jgi:PAS domain S-box-containing protein